MTLMPVRIAFTLVSLLASVAPSAGADDASPAAIEALPRIRTLEPRVHALIDVGVELSNTLRALVTRLEHSDVVTYIQYDRAMPRALAGRLTFVSAVGGLRYVLMRVAENQPVSQQIAIIGHELQHAVEIAARPSIVDGRTLLHEYERIGQITRWPGATTVDTDAARRSESQVRTEVACRGADLKLTGWRLRAGPAADR